MRVSVGKVRENGRRSDARHQATDTKIDCNYKSHDEKIDSITFLLFGFAVAAAAMLYS